MQQWTQDEVLKMLEKAGAISRNQHFVYQSDNHGRDYVDMDRVYPDTRAMQRLATLLVFPFVRLGRVQVVAGNADSGGALVCDVAHRLRQTGYPVDRVWADKVGDDFAFNRAGFADRLKGKRVLVVDDLLTADDSVAKVCLQVEAAGGNVIAASVICNQSGLTSETLGWELHALCEMFAEDIAADDCSLCMHGVPIVTNIGHGGAFQAANPDYYGGYTQL